MSEVVVGAAGIVVAVQVPACGHRPSRQPIGFGNGLGSCYRRRFGLAKCGRHSWRRMTAPAQGRWVRNPPQACQSCSARASSYLHLAQHRRPALGRLSVVAGDSQKSSCGPIAKHGTPSSVDGVNGLAGDRWRLRPVWTDAAIAAGFVVLTLLESATSGMAGVGWRVAAVACLAWRRRFPEAVAVVVVLAAVWTDRDGQLIITLAIVLVTYTVGNELAPRRAVPALAGVMILLLIASWLVNAPPSPSDMAALFVLCLAPGLIGMGQHRRMQREVAAVASAAAAEERRLVDTEQAVLRERTRIARELHDVVSHSLTVITINTQAVRRSLGASHSREVTALSMVEATAREASAEMRRLFGILRAEGSGPLEPQPGLAQLPGLVDRLAAVGLPVTVEIPERADTAPGVGAALDVTAYRIIQEALTNVLRHADASRALVRIQPADGLLVIEVEDDGTGPGIDLSKTAGQGLLGIHERAQVFGGQVEFGGTGHGFRVRVTLPMEAGT
jgi:signal transduction histidine kinase